MDFFIENIKEFLMFSVVFFVLGGIVEGINPAPKSKERIASIKKQILHSLPGLFMGVLTVNTWRNVVDPHLDSLQWLPRNWFGKREVYNSDAFILDTAIFIVVYDTIFYWVHRILHTSYFYRILHKEHHYHHTTMTNFASSATSLGEIVINSIGLCTPLLFTPIPQEMHQLYLLGTHIYSVFSHDTHLDYMNHTAHHRYHNVNYGAYTVFWDRVMNTQYRPIVKTE